MNINSRDCVPYKGKEPERKKEGEGQPLECIVAYIGIKLKKRYHRHDLHHCIKSSASTLASGGKTRRDYFHAGVVLVAAEAEDPRCAPT